MFIELTAPSGQSELISVAQGVTEIKSIQEVK